LAGVALILVLGILGAIDTPPEETAGDSPEPPAIADTPAEKVTPPIFTLRQETTTPSLLAYESQGRLYSIGPNAVTDLTDGTSYPFPDGAGNATMATFMPDLSAFFILLENENLLAFTTANNRFSPNTLPLPAGSTPVALSAYLTYLYVLDDAGNIYRFPRIEGGFDTPKNWFQGGTVRPDSTTLAISENIALGSTANPFIETFSRGTPILSFRFAVPDRNIAINGIAWGDDGSLFLLDGALPGIVQLSQNGTLIRESAHAEARDKTSLTVGADRSLLLAGPDGIIRATLP
jgi:hypothetical protein